MADAPPLERYPGNPILTPTKLWWESRWVYNCGATLFGGKVALLYRAQGADSISRFGLALLDEGAHVVERSPYPVFEPAAGNEWEQLGVEDPRITQHNGRYYICYTAASLYPALKPVQRKRASPFTNEGVPWRTRISIATTRDFNHFRRLGLAFRLWDEKNSALFPLKIRGRYYLLHRIFPDIHLGWSRDLRHWHNLGVVLPTRPGTWDSNRVGAGAPPFWTPYGWLLFYHGVDDQRTYRLGVALLDLDHPQHVLGRSENPVLEPQQAHEREGLVPNVVFCCGAVELGDRYFVYYGAADSVIAVATVTCEAVLNWAAAVAAKAHQGPGHRRRPATRAVPPRVTLQQATG